MGIEQFTGDAILKVIPGEARKMELVDDLFFTDPDGKTWHAPAGSIVDGASIPRFFWRFIGGPWSGLYKRASIIHDVYCKTQTESWKSVHGMFKAAMRADGVGKWKARMMFKAVWFGGPRWEVADGSV